MSKILGSINGFVWGIPALVMIIGVGIYFSIQTGFVQFTLFPRAFHLLLKQFKRSKTGSQTPYRSLCTALAATVGTGNLAGVAGAICIGGPGVIFWMWICAMLGMVIKFAEATLAVRFCTKNANAEKVGGPMYMIENGLGSKWKWLGKIYCFLCIFASLGVGNATQINTVIGALNGVMLAGGYNVGWLFNLAVGIILGVVLGALFLGGAKKIGEMAEKLVPFASALYLVLGVLIIILRFNVLPSVFSSIIEGAFSPNAVTGGILGSAFTSLRVGASRGVFTNEAGMGTASIAHGTADVKHPVEQGLMGLIEVFLDTIVICTVTALVILSSGVAVPYGQDIGIMLTSEAFSAIYGKWAYVLIAFSVCCFAIATILGWGLYGARCAQYLLGEDFWGKFVIIQIVIIIIGSVMGTGTVWLMAEIVNGLMAIPNLLALILLSPELFKLTREYKRNPTQ